MTDQINDYIEQKYDTIRHAFQEMLIDVGYSPRNIDEVDDGRDEFCVEYYKIAHNIK